MLTADRAELASHLGALINERRFNELQRELVGLDAPDLAEVIIALGHEHEAVVFRLLPKELATRTFEHLPLEIQEELLYALGDRDVAGILDDMSPDDRTALLEELPGKVTRRLINLLSGTERQVATRLLGYPEESIGRLMTPDYVAIKPAWTVKEALAHIRKFGKDRETLDVLYVIASGGRLIDDIRTRELLLAEFDMSIHGLMDEQFVALSAYDDQEVAVDVFRKYDRTALPVVDRDGVLVGIVTVDDVLDVAEAEATEDIQMLGGSEALQEPYLSIRLTGMIRKRAPWLILLFFGQMLTATAMSSFEEELASALVLALFIPLVISSGGNSGSQAATLIIRAITIGEVRLRDWWRVVRRETASAAVIGGILGLLGFGRVAAGEFLTGSYGPHWFLIGSTIGLSLLGVVVWGSTAGAVLPLLLRRVGLDPAASSTPFVATLVDVTGIIIYFSVAAVLLKGTLL